ncbi:MAG: FIG00803858: hypothetical protein, partial [uncultured Craurococcus sp.]
VPCRRGPARGRGRGSGDDACGEARAERHRAAEFLRAGAYAGAAARAQGAAGPGAARAELGDALGPGHPARHRPRGDGARRHRRALRLLPLPQPPPAERPEPGECDGHRRAALDLAARRAGGRYPAQGSLRLRRGRRRGSAGNGPGLAGHRRGGGGLASRGSCRAVPRPASCRPRASRL